MMMGIAAIATSAATFQKFFMMLSLLSYAATLKPRLYNNKLRTLKT